MATLFEWDAGTLPAKHGGGAINLATGEGFPTAPAIEVVQTSGQAAAALFAFAAQDQVGVRAYFKMPAPGSTSQVLLTTNVGSGDPSARFAIGGTGQPGQARLTKAGSTVAQSANGLLTTGTYYRCELLHDGAGGRARVGIFATGSTSPLWDSGWMTDAAFSTTAIDHSRVGSYNAAPVLGSYLIDSIKGTDDISTWVGPHAGETPPAGFTVSYWDGTTEIPATVSIWDGTTEAPASIEL